MTILDPRCDRSRRENQLEDAKVFYIGIALAIAVPWAIYLLYGWMIG